MTVIKYIHCKHARSSLGDQSCPWIGLTNGLVEIFQFLVGWVGSTIPKLLKILKDYVNALKARLDKISLHQLSS